MAISSSLPILALLLISLTLITGQSPSAAPIPAPKLSPKAAPVSAPAKVPSSPAGPGQNGTPGGITISPSGVVTIADGQNGTPGGIIISPSGVTIINGQPGISGGVRSVVSFVGLAGSFLLVAAF